MVAITGAFRSAITPSDDRTHNEDHTTAYSATIEGADCFAHHAGPNVRNYSTDNFYADIIIAATIVNTDGNAIICNTINSAYYIAISSAFLSRNVSSYSRNVCTYCVIIVSFRSSHCFKIFPTIFGVITSSQ